MAKVGRKVRYSPSILERTYQMASKGKTIDQIAKALGVDRATMYMWRNKYDEFNDALKKGRNEVLDKVEESLYRRAVGYTCTETKQIFEISQDGQPRPAKVEKTKKIISPDVGAAAFILKTQRPEQWKQMPNQIELVGERPIIVAPQWAPLLEEKDENIQTDTGTD